MRLRTTVLLCILAAALAPAISVADDVVQRGDVVATIGSDEVSLCNARACRTWFADRLETKTFGGNGLPAAGAGPDFRLILDGIEVTADVLPLTSVTAAAIDGGVGITWELDAGAATLRREVEMYEGIAGVQSRTVVVPRVGVALSGYSLDEVALGDGASATAHAFRAGADWRFDDDWDPFTIGDAHQGDWHVETTGDTVDAPGQWLSVDTNAGTVGLVMERNDYASSRVAFDGAVARADVDLSRDVVYFGPIEESVHTENPGPGPARHRALLPGTEVALERAFTVLARDADDEAWQYHRYLTEHRLTPYPRAVTFNTNRVDSNVISTGAKDDVDFARLQALVPAAREMGVDTFILDDGWQAISGDWCPDSAGCPEPRGMFPDRFPDDEFAAVRELLAGDPDDPADDLALGLWMTPMEFHPASSAYGQNPQWACAPVGHATAALSIADPDGGSNEAGIGVWNPLAIGTHPDTGEVLRLVDYIEDRITRMIEVYGATYFKFDFLVWVDCLGIAPTDIYAYMDAFIDMVDRLQAAHPEVTYQIDETNDYRLFPFASVARGPSWFQNGSPPTERLLHNLWNLAPYIPTWSIGQHALDNTEDRENKGIDMLMAAALPSHITIWAEIDTELTPAERAQVKRWTDFSRAHPDLTGFTMPLLEDPLAGDWTALQTWDPSADAGWVFAFRQSSADAARTIPLRALAHLPAEEMFEVVAHDPADGSEVALGTFSAEELRAAGLPVTIDTQHGYRLVRLDRT